MLTRQPTMRRAQASMTKSEGGCAFGPSNPRERNEPRPCGEKGEIRHPEHVLCGHHELAGHFVARACPILVGDWRLVRLAADDAPEYACSSSA